MEYYHLLEVKFSLLDNIKFDSNTYHILKAAESQANDWMEKYGKYRGKSDTLENIASNICNYSNQLELVSQQGDERTYLLYSRSVKYYLTFEKAPSKEDRMVTFYSNGSMVSTSNDKKCFTYTFEKSFSALRLHNKYVIEAKIGNRELIMFKGGVLPKREYQELVASLRK